MKKITFILTSIMLTVLGGLSVFAESNAASGDANANTGGGFGSWWIWILVYGGMFALFYFLLIRPNRKKQKAEEALKNSIAMGDTITTIGGITGRIVSIKDDEITIESSLDRTLVTFKKWAVRDVVKPESDDVPVPEIKDKNKDEKDDSAEEDKKD